MSLCLKKVREAVLNITGHLALSLASVHYSPKVPVPHSLDNSECLQMRITDLEEVDPGSSSDPKSSPSFSDFLVPVVVFPGVSVWCLSPWNTLLPFICVFFDPEPFLGFSISWLSTFAPHCLHLVFEQTRQFHPWLDATC